MNIVNATSLVAVALLAAGTTASAQEAPAAPPITYLRPVTFPVLAPIAQAESDQQQPAPRAAADADRRDDIKMLEAVFTTAVKNGSDRLALQMQTVDPASLFVTGTGRTRGFDLQGYGVFFDVDVPMMKQSVLWSTRLLNQQDTRLSLENYVATLPPGPERNLAINQLRRMQQQGRQSGIASPSQIANPGAVVALNADGAATSPTLQQPAPDPRDPNELYTEAVKTSLIDAMLKYSVGLKLGAEEWLTVAARDAEGPLAPGIADDASTIILRIKGSDLTAFHSGKLTREEVRKKVEVKEF